MQESRWDDCAKKSWLDAITLHGWGYKVVTLKQQVPKTNTYFLPHSKPNLHVKSLSLLLRTWID